MSKYIDAERLRAEIEQLLEFDGTVKTDYYIGKRDAELVILSFLDSLQQEQPVEELEEEIKRMVYDVVYDLDGPAIKGTSEYLSVEDVAFIARHFAEWGAEHARKEDK